jgi:hypothetical protein
LLRLASASDDEKGESGDENHEYAAHAHSLEENATSPESRNPALSRSREKTLVRQTAALKGDRHLRSFEYPALI